MSQVQSIREDYSFEIHSCLPRVSREEVREQIDRIFSQGWNLAVEHMEPALSFKHYWQMWKPGASDAHGVDAILQELEACHRTHPRHHIRLMGYEDYARRQDTAFVVYRGV